MRSVWTVTALLAAAPALAETADERLDRHCRAALEFATSYPEDFPASGRYDGVRDGWCRFRDVRLTSGGYDPDIWIDELDLRGDAFGFFTLGEKPETPGLRAEAKVGGLHIVPKAHEPLMDYLLAAQAQSWAISVEAALDWDAAGRVLRLSRLDLDFPGENAVSLSVTVANVDLSSDGAMQMSVTGFAVTEAALDVTTKGLFESYLLMPLGSELLPFDGDVLAAAENLRLKALGGIAAMPEAAVPAASKDALSRLMAEMPNPSGRLTMAFRADPGFGPSRLGFIGLYGMPGSVAEAAPLFQGVTLDVTWTHEDAD